MSMTTYKIKTSYIEKMASEYKIIPFTKRLREITEIDLKSAVNIYYGFNPEQDLRGRSKVNSKNCRTANSHLPMELRHMRKHFDEPNCDKRRYSTEQIKAQKREAKEQIAMLRGLPPHNVPSNINYGDAYFANSIKRRFNCSDIAKIWKWANS